jgi:hypothetical protein
MVNVVPPFVVSGVSTATGLAFLDSSFFDVAASPFIANALGTSRNSTQLTMIFNDARACALITPRPFFA